MPVQVLVGSEGSAFATSNEGQCSNSVRPMSVKTLAPNEILFQVGDPRGCLYRVEAGSVCIYEPRLTGGRANIDFAGPGDLLGLGFLKKQTCTARAMVETRIACLPLASVDSLVAGDPKAEAKLAQAIEREFELQRSSLVEAGRRNPMGRVAALLVALSQVNKHDGRDPNVIATPWQCGPVAHQLELSLDDLAQILLDLEELGLIEVCDVHSATHGLRIKDPDRLEEIADRVCTAGSAISIMDDETRPAQRVSPRRRLPGEETSGAA